MITNPGHGITLGGLSLMADGDSVDHAEGFTTEVSADGATWGNPEVVVSSLISELSDGDIVTQTRSGNRQPVLHVRISADTHAGLIAGDTALGAVVGLPCELVWQNPDPLAPATVIDVVHSRMDHSWDDMDALRRRRTWVVTMSALPWPHSATKVITPAVATGATTVVNAGSATTGWTSTNGTVTVVSGAVVSSYNGLDQFTRLQLTGTVDTSVQHYIAIDWKSAVPAFQAVRVTGSTNLAEVRREPAPTATFTRSWYRVPDSSTGFILMDIVHPSIAGTQTLSIDQVIKAETLPVSGSTKQITRTVDPGGNVPAEGSILVTHATEGLGQVLIHSHPSIGGYSPPLRRWLVASDTVGADATSTSGATHTLGGVTTYKIPVASIPQGDVHLWARLLRDGPATQSINWTAASTMGQANVGASQQGSTACNFPSAGTWYLFPLARLTLPTARMGTSGVIFIELHATANMYIDESWLFAMDRGRLTVVDCGSGTPDTGTVQTCLRVMAPSLEAPFGAIELANSPDWSDAYTPAASKVQCDQTGHRFDADGSTIHVVTAGPTTEASVSFEHYPRWRAEAGT